jgi:hypothetical protein
MPALFVFLGKSLSSDRARILASRCRKCMVGKHFTHRKLNPLYGVYSDVGKINGTDFGSVEAEI